MANLHGRKMKKGDIVYDILYGAGRVVDDGGGELNVLVSFSEDGMVRYSQDGKLSGKQRLYWSQPLVRVANGPDDVVFETTKKITDVVYEQLQEFFRKGKKAD